MRIRERWCRHGRDNVRPRRDRSALLHNLPSSVFTLSNLARTVCGLSIRPARHNLRLTIRQITSPERKFFSSRCGEAASSPSNIFCARPLVVSSAITPSSLTCRSRNFFQRGGMPVSRPRVTGGIPAGTSAPDPQNAGAKFTSPIARFFRFTKRPSMIAINSSSSALRLPFLGFFCFRCSRDAFHPDSPSPSSC